MVVKEGQLNEKSYGPAHPNVALRLNNLAALLKDTNLLSEAEDLSRRPVVIHLKFMHLTGYLHPNSGLSSGSEVRN